MMEIQTTETGVRQVVKLKIRSTAQESRQYVQIVKVIASSALMLLRVRPVSMASTCREALAWPVLQL